MLRVFVWMILWEKGKKEKNVNVSPLCLVPVIHSCDGADTGWEHDRFCF